MHRLAIGWVILQKGKKILIGCQTGKLPARRFLGGYGKRSQEQGGNKECKLT